ncbi:hypothetical protein SDC9_188440 [bioreactor metagenome]|uniref:Uncharacterized protein n=1 Tax=bioreactor metagenome TaxID=1076179 RepID=A0A645HPX4_9ZZZZ
MGPCVLQEGNSVLGEALKSIGGGAGLVGAAPEGRRPRRLDRPGHTVDLILALHRAGTGDDGKLCPAQQCAAAQVNYTVVRVVFAVGFFEGLGNPHHPLHAGQQGDFLSVNARRVAFGA